MLSSALRRYGCNRTLHNLQKRLLNTLPGDIPCDGWIFRLPCDLIDLVDIDNPILCSLNISIRRLNNLEKNIFHIFPDVSGFGQSRGVRNRKWNIEHLRQCLCQKRFPASGRSKHQNIALLQLHPKISLCFDPLVMIIDRNGKNLFGLLLPNHIIIQKALYLFRLQEINLSRPVIFVFIIKFFFYNLGTDLNTFVTDICSVWPRNQLAHLRLWLITEGTSHYIFF